MSLDKKSLILDWRVGNIESEKICEVLEHKGIKNVVLAPSQVNIQRLNKKIWLCQRIKINFKFCLLDIFSHFHYLHWLFESQFNKTRNFILFYQDVSVSSSVLTFISILVNHNESWNGRKFVVDVYEDISFLWKSPQLQRQLVFSQSRKTLHITICREGGRIQFHCKLFPPLYIYLAFIYFHLPSLPSCYFYSYFNKIYCAKSFVT